MIESPLGFYRGAAKIMAGDLARTPDSGLSVQCCGDAHLSNFGFFASPGRQLVFDISGFDETLPGPWEWDVKRLAVSLLIAAREDGFGVEEQEVIVLQAARSYRKAMREFARMNHLAVWYSRLDVDSLLRKYAAQFQPPKVEETEDERDLLHAAGFVSELRLEGLSDLLYAYRETLQDDGRTLLDQFELSEVVRQEVSGGILGSRAWLALLFGRSEEDSLRLEMKEARASVLEEHLGPPGFADYGQRVVLGQRRMECTRDVFLGWAHLEAEPNGDPRDFYVRRLRTERARAPIEQMTPRGMATYGRLCGWTLARAHSRSGDRIAIAAYLGGGSSFDRAILEFSRAYADQNERDFYRLKAAVSSGRIAVRTRPSLHP
jgi:uncharacterized protein (DUF2252 family)